jgi:hypothetical protein
MAHIEAAALGYTRRMTQWAPNPNPLRGNSALP